MNSVHVGKKCKKMEKVQKVPKVPKVADHGRPKHFDIRGATSISDAFIIYNYSTYTPLNLGSYQ